jgi:hypothetical protein
VSFCTSQSVHNSSLSPPLNFVVPLLVECKAHLLFHECGQSDPGSDASDAEDDIDPPSQPRAASGPDAAGEGADGDVSDVHLSGDWKRIDVPGGFLMWSKVSRALDAHCSCAAHRRGTVRCKTDRTLRESRSHDGGQGRPLGRLLWWLASGADLDGAGHRAFKKSAGTVVNRQSRLQCRYAFQVLALSNPVAADILKDERPQRAGECCPEPEMVP